MNSLSRGGSKESENGDEISTGPTKDAITCSRVMRRKRYHHQNQSRRRLVVSRRRRSCGDNNKEEEDMDDAERQQQQQGKWNKLMDLLFIDISSKEGMVSGGFSAQRKQNWLTSLLPPPPPRTASKILPPPTSSSSSSSTSKSVIINTRGNWRMQDKDTIHQDHVRKFQEEVLIMNQLQKNVILRPSSCNRPSSNSSFITSSQGHGYGYQQRIAPAVQIRSVIPVRAAPPPAAAPPMIPSSSSPEVILTTKKAPADASLTLPASASGSTTTELSSKLSKLRL